jgi:hypothetical protein
VKFRVSIAGIMAAGVLIALDCMVIRTLGDYRQPMGNVLILCCLPMTNVLAAVLLRIRAGLRRGTTRPFPIGFAAAGVAALAIYSVLVVAFPQTMAHAVDDPLGHLDPLAKRGTAGIATVVVLALAWSQAPLLVPALLGGWLYRRSRKSKPGAIAAVPSRPLGIGRHDAGCHGLSSTRAAGPSRGFRR